MDAGVQGMLAHLEATWDGLLEAVGVADDRAFYWTPGPEFNSIAILLRHLAGSERWWIGEAIGGIPSHRMREAEFARDRPRREEVLRAVEEARRTTRQALSPMTMEDLQAEMTVAWGKPPRRSSKLSALLHYIDHLGYHRGQSLLLLRLTRPTRPETTPR